ncbi:YaeQ family protein [Rheinheimera marina]|uniref:YaeQ family protein n=2 Tax=Gammaproteobacteria TaxID=1236 RepID=A0ABV9JJT7_9GAMM
MQLASKVIRLDLNYSSEQSHYYRKTTTYLAPFKEESAEHFARRILAYLSLFEHSPAIARQDGRGKSPDLYIEDQYSQLRLWCAVDVLDEKLMQRASHQAEQVLLLVDELDYRKSKGSYRRHFPNLICTLLTHESLLSFCEMLQGHMQLDVWRDGDQLLITDGQHSLELTFAPTLLH